MMPSHDDDAKILRLPPRQGDWSDLGRAHLEEIKSEKDAFYLQYGTDWLENFDNAVVTLCDRSESPIECLLAITLIGEIQAKFSVKFSATEAKTEAGVLFYTYPHDIGNRFCLLTSQQWIDQYRVDFQLIVYPPNRTLAIECDGHDYHERTKDQAKHDRRRDRYMQARGINVLRFTGAEIRENARHCASEVCNFIYNSLLEPQ